MLPFRPMVALLITSGAFLAGTAQAQIAFPPSNGADNVRPKPAALTNESLGKMLAVRYPKELVPSKDDKPAKDFLLKLSYSPLKSKESFDWTVSCEAVERAGQSPMVRVWFNCQLLPENVDAGRLLAMLDWSGGHGVSRGFFKTTRYRNGTMLSLVVEAPPEDATEERFPRVLDGLLQMAAETRHLWSGKLDEPLAKPAAKSAVTEADLLGSWDGKVFLDGKKVGDYSAAFAKGGTVVVSRANTTVEKPKVDIDTGHYSVADGRLKLSMGQAAQPDVYNIALDGKTMTWTMKRGESVLTIQLTRSE